MTYGIVDLVHTTAPRDTISFADQALLNYQALESIRANKIAYAGMDFDTYLRIMEMSVTGGMLREEKAKNKEPLRFEFDMNHYKRSMKDYVQLQTNVIYEIMKRTPAVNSVEPLSPDQFDLKKVHIGQFRENDIGTSEEALLLSGIISGITEKVALAQAPGAIATCGSPYGCRK